MTQLGLWSKFEGGKTVSLAEIVDTTKADEIMISMTLKSFPFRRQQADTQSFTVRIFRQLTAAGVLVDTPGPGYGLTPIGLPYLNPDHQAFTSFVYQDIIPSIYAMPRTLSERGYKAPTKESGSARTRTTPSSWSRACARTT